MKHYYLCTPAVLPGISPFAVTSSFILAPRLKHGNYTVPAWHRTLQPQDKTNPVTPAPDNLQSSSLQLYGDDPLRGRSASMADTIKPERYLRYLSRPPTMISHRTALKRSTGSNHPGRRAPLREHRRSSSPLTAKQRSKLKGLT